VPLCCAVAPSLGGSTLDALEDLSGLP
jgi:hypothetical protein